MRTIYRTKNSFQEFSVWLNYQTANYVRVRQLLVQEIEINRLLFFFD